MPVFSFILNFYQLCFNFCAKIYEKENRDVHDQRYLHFLTVREAPEKPDKLFFSGCTIITTLKSKLTFMSNYIIKV